MSQDAQGTRESFARRVLRAAFVSLIVVYFLGMACAVPYYNVSYAAEKGFGRWLAGGQMASTAKGFLWPYFMIFDPGSPFKHGAHSQS
jgi:hypothetical protein